MTYAVIDLARRDDDVRRAGHTPLIYMPGPASRRTGAQILTPSGMVLGLRIDGAEEKFGELLEEERVDSTRATSSSSTRTASPRR